MLWYLVLFYSRLHNRLVLVFAVATLTIHGEFEQTNISMECHECFGLMKHVVFYCLSILQRFNLSHVKDA